MGAREPSLAATAARPARRRVGERGEERVSFGAVDPAALGRDRAADDRVVSGKDLAPTDPSVRASSVDDATSVNNIAIVPTGGAADAPSTVGSLRARRPLTRPAEHHEIAWLRLRSRRTAAGPRADRKTPAHPDGLVSALT